MKKIYALHMISLLLTSITFQTYSMYTLQTYSTNQLHIPNSVANLNEYEQSLENFLCETSILFNLETYKNNDLIYFPRNYNEGTKRKILSNSTSQENPNKKQKTISSSTAVYTFVNNNSRYYKQNNLLKDDTLNKNPNNQVNNLANINTTNTVYNNNNNQINVLQLNPQNNPIYPIFSYNNTNSPTATTIKKTFNCYHCNEQLLSRNELCDHVINIHPTKVFNCRYCNTLCISQRRLNSHINSYHQIKKNTCSYNNCGKKFPSKKDLIKHIIAMHANELFK